MNESPTRLRTPATMCVGYVPVYTQYASASLVGRHASMKIQCELHMYHYM